MSHNLIIHFNQSIYHTTPSTPGEYVRVYYISAEERERENDHGVDDNDTTSIQPTNKEEEEGECRAM